MDEVADQCEQPVGREERGQVCVPETSSALIGLLSTGLAALE